MIHPSPNRGLRSGPHSVWLGMAVLVAVACGPRSTPSGPPATTPAGAAPPPPIDRKSVV